MRVVLLDSACFIIHINFAYEQTDINRHIMKIVLIHLIISYTNTEIYF